MTRRNSDKRKDSNGISRLAPQVPDKPMALSFSFPVPSTAPVSSPNGNIYPDLSPAKMRRGLNKSVSYPQLDRDRRTPEYPDNKSWEQEEAKNPWEQEDVKPPTNSPALQVDIPAMALGALNEALDIATDVFRRTWSAIRFPAKYLLVTYLVIYLSAFIINQLAAQVSGVICAQPLLALSLSGLGVCNKGGNSTKQQKIDFAKATEAQEPLEDVLRQAGRGASLAIGMKGSEHAVRDLAMKVQSSELDCKEAMGAELGGFIRRAKPMVRKLSKFSAKVGTVVDIVIANDNYALKTLAAIQARKASHHPLDSRILNMIDPLAMFRSKGTPKQDEEDLKKAFIQTTSSTVRSIPPLIKDAELILQDLDALEEGLKAIADMAEEEKRTGKAQDPSKSQHAALARLWENINGEAFRQMEAFKSHTALLESVGEYQKEAMAVVVETLATLLNMQANMEEFMDLHTQTAFLSDDTPLEVHMETIRAGVDRLNRERWTISGGSYSGDGIES
ncbi:hypothetical protein TWF694_010077 [Orbilia ellipsospora]|uniref:Uncharacterized protein n=1 Tax=Orbilia ellipsospora TaxID=2528407 RepID=A0AAV9X8T0_9PEZI